MANFNFKIVYRPGSRRGKPDALSRQPESRPEEGATHCKQPIVKPEHFEISSCHKKDRIQVGLVERKVTITNSLRIKKLLPQGIIPTKGSRMAAGQDIYALKNGTIPAQRQMLVEKGIAIGLPKGTYGRLAAQSGKASKHGITVGGGVIGADYTGEVRVILRNHGTTDYEFKAGDRIAQLIVERIPTSEAMVVDKLVKTERGTQGFGSTDLDPNHLITRKEHKVLMSFLHPDPGNNTFYDKEDILTHADMTREVTLLSNAIIAAVQMQTMDETFLDRFRMTGKDDDTWTERKGDLSRMKEPNEQRPKNWELDDGLIYYTNRLFINSNEDL